MIREVLARWRNHRYDARYRESQRERILRERQLAAELGALRVFSFEDPHDTGRIRAAS